MDKLCDRHACSERRETVNRTFPCDDSRLWFSLGGLSVNLSSLGRGHCCPCSVRKCSAKVSGSLLDMWFTNDSFLLPDKIFVDAGGRMAEGLFENSGCLTPLAAQPSVELTTSVSERRQASCMLLTFVWWSLLASLF
jgi:hypothetical protein